MIGLFYVLCSYAWVVGTGFDNFAAGTPAQANPWRNLGKVFWSTGWILIFLAISNSTLANSNAGVNAATRVIYAMARNGLAPRALAHTHPVAQDAARGDHREDALAIVVALADGLEVGTADRASRSSRTR